MIYGWLVGIVAALLGGGAALALKTYKAGPWLGQPPLVPPTMPPITPKTMPTAPDRVYDVAKSLLGRHLTLNPSVPEEEGCAEACSVVLIKAGYPIPHGGISSVRGLTNWMMQNHFKEVSAPQPGAIICAHNINELVTDYAHVGVCLKFVIASNILTRGGLSHSRHRKQYERKWLISRELQLYKLA